MGNMRDTNMLNTRTSLPYHGPFPEKITDGFMACKVLSAGARADARDNLVEINKTNSRVRWRVVPN